MLGALTACLVRGAAQGNSIWTHWQVHWAYVRHMFNLYTGFPGNLSLSVCHRTAGVNIRRTLGPDTAMITGAVLSDPGYTDRDPASGLPMWWTNLPPARSMQLYDFCFRPLPNWRQPVTSLEQLKTVMPIFGAVSLAPWSFLVALRPLLSRGLAARALCTPPALWRRATPLPMFHSLCCLNHWAAGMRLMFWGCWDEAHVVRLVPVLRG